MFYKPFDIIQRTYMKPINYQLTNNIVNNLIDLEKIISQINLTEIPEKTKKTLQENTSSQNIIHVAKIFGENITLKDAKKLSLGDLPKDKKNAFLLINNFRNVLEYVQSGSMNIHGLNTNTLIHINKILIYKWKETWEAKLRTTDLVDPDFDDWLIFKDDSIVILNIEKETKSTIDWVHVNWKNINPIIVSGVTIYRLMRIAPFIYLNKPTIIAITTLLLEFTGIGKNNFLSVPKIFNKYSDDFLPLWEKATSSMTGNITYWLEAFTKALQQELEEIYKSMKSELEKQEVEAKKKPFLYLNKRQLKILKYLQTIPHVKREEYVKMFNISPMTAYRDLLDLKKRKLIKPVGNGRSTFYTLSTK